MKTFTAIVLNIFYPGTGYLYLKDKFRREIAIFLIWAWSLTLVGIIYSVVNSWITNSPYNALSNSSPQEIPLLAYAMWGFMVYDTFKLARKIKYNSVHRVEATLLLWDIYEITNAKTEIHGVMLRGRIRKLGLTYQFDVLCENATDKENCVRFATLTKDDAEAVKNYLKSIINDAHIDLVIKQVANPVLSKLKVNQQDRYTL